MRRPLEPSRALDGLHFDLAARQVSLNRLLDRFEEFARTRHIPTGIQRDVHLALDEIVSNIIRHGARLRPRCRITVNVRLEGSMLSIEVVDNGRRFDPVAAPTPAPRGPVLKRPKGGLGIRLVKGIMDSVTYRRRDGRNYVLLTRGVEPRSV